MCRFKLGSQLNSSTDGPGCNVTDDILKDRRLGTLDWDPQVSQMRRLRPKEG